MSHNSSALKNPDLRKCGVILVEPKSNSLAMSCIYCESIFFRIPTFIRHLHQRHKEYLQFEPEMEVYAVEELHAESEESSVADNDLAKSEKDGAKDNLTKDKKIETNIEVKNYVPANDTPLGNISILKALEDSDVSLNIVVSMDSTIVEGETHGVVESNIEKGDDITEREQSLENANSKDIDMETSDFDMDSSILKHIQLALELENEEDQKQNNINIEIKSLDVAKDVVGRNSFVEDDDLNVTLSENSAHKSPENLSLTNVSSLNNILSGLEDIDDVDALLDDLENGVIALQGGTETKEKKSNVIIKKLEDEKDEYNLNASILELAEDNLDEEKQKELEDKLNQVFEDNSDEEKSNQGIQTALILQVMAECDLVDCMNSDEANTSYEKNQQLKDTSAYNMSVSDLNNAHEYEAKSICDNAHSQIQSIPLLTKEDNKNGSLLELSSEASTIYEQIVKSFELPKNNDEAKDDEGQNMNEKESGDTFGKRNDSDPPKADEFYAKSKTPISSPRAPRKQKERLSAGGEGKEIIIPKSFVKTPTTSTIEGKENTSNINVSPKANSAKSFYKKTPVEEMGLYKKEKTPNLKSLIDHTQTATPLAESEKELETNILYAGLTEENSSTHLYEETNKLNIPEKMGYTLQSLLNEDLKGEYLDTLISQLETTNRECIVGEPSEKTTTVLNLSETLEAGCPVDNDDDMLEEEMTIFNKFINRIEHQVVCESQLDGEDDFKNLLNDELSKALENALGEETIIPLLEEEESNELQIVASIENSEEEINDRSSELHKVSPDLQILQVSKISENGNIHQENNKSKDENVIKSGSTQHKEQYASTNQKTKNIKEKPVKVSDSVSHQTKKIQTKGTHSENVDYPKTELILENPQFNPFEQTYRAPKMFKESNENSPHEMDAWNNLEKSEQNSDTGLITGKMEKNFVTIQSDDRTPIGLPHLFLNQSPKTQEKTGENLEHNVIQRTPDGNPSKKSPSEDCKRNVTQMISPKNARTDTALPAINIPQQKQSGNLCQNLNNLNMNSPIVGFKGPQRLRNVLVRVRRWSSTQSQNKPCEKLTAAPNNMSSLRIEKDQYKNNIPLSKSEKEKLKLLDCITISKVNTNTSPTAVEDPPSKFSNCKKNFTEQQIDGAHSGTRSDSAEILKCLPRSVTKTAVAVAKRGRVREASIDVIPEPKSPKKKCKPNYNRYAISRSQRKKEVLQRMRYIKKHTSNASGTLGNIVKSQMCKKKSKRYLVKINRVQMLSNIQEQVLTPLLEGQNISPQLSILHSGDLQTTPNSIMGNCKETAKSLITSPKHAPQDLGNVSYLGNKTPVKNTMPTKELKTLFKSAEKVENQQISPKFNFKSKTPERSSTAATKVIDIQSTVAERGSSQIAKTPTSGGVRLSKRAATSPLADEKCPKRAPKSPSRLKQGTQISHTAESKLGLSKSVMDFIQTKKKRGEAAAKNRGLKDSRINSCGEQTMPINEMTSNQTPKKSEKKDTNNVGESKEHDENYTTTEMLHDLLGQVTTEDSQRSTRNTNVKEKEAKRNISRNAQIKKTSSLGQHVEDYNYSKELNLVEKFGLNILVDTHAEDFCDLKEVKEMRAKAKKFAELLKQFKRLCSCSKLIEPVQSFQNLLTHVNDSFGVNISINDIKHLINLLICWYINCYNNKLIHKKPVPESSNHYMLTFNFIPKNTKRSYYCEFCNEIFGCAHKFYTHRIIHTAAKFPYMCKSCPEGFNRANLLKTHTQDCSKKHESKTINQDKSKQSETAKMPISKVEISNTVRDDKSNGWVTVKSRSNILYKCIKCLIFFSTERDAKLHINSCNTFERTQPKKTPRPKPKA